MNESQDTISEQCGLSDSSSDFEETSPNGRSSSPLNKSPNENSS